MTQRIERAVRRTSHFIGLQRLHQVVDGSQLKRLNGIVTADSGEHDGTLGGFLNGLDAIHARQQHIHERHVERGGAL